jgi:hydrogenase maturation protein HypF
VSVRVRVKGIVQGVGFRPFVYLLAQEHGLCGWVLNDQNGVEIQLEGEQPQIDRFLNELPTKAPPASRLDSVASEPSLCENLREFCIVESRPSSSITTRISPDLALCANCLAELSDSQDPHFQYPYVNCTHCGPRYSIIKSLPYDRAATTMAPWAMCVLCAAGYKNPADRRFHAQPVACPDCGPNFYFAASDGVAVARGPEAIKQCAEHLRRGKIVAIKGIGGYHLALDATNSTALEALRQRKYRKDKPFALMPATLELAEQLVALDDESRKLLTSIARPIVLAPARIEANLKRPDDEAGFHLDLSLIAPDNQDLGLMLPYTPLHYLLFQLGAPELLVLTSANRSSEPIAYADEQALSDLEGIADYFLIGERPIQRRIDDSVAALSKAGVHIIRRARGLAPDAVAKLPATKPILALGADLKNAITLVVAGQAFVSQYIGDLEHFGCYQAFQETIRDLFSMYEIKASELTIVRDRHPQYISSQYAAALEGSVLAVQHHRAHVASVLAERELFDARVIGIAFDGTGWGDDEAVWGGEFFVGSVSGGFTREAWLEYAQLPGGDAAARFPPQAAAGFILGAGQNNEQLVQALMAPPFSFPQRFKLAAQLVERQVQCWPTTSAGRLFDAAAALAGFRTEISFEAQAAIWLEHKARLSRTNRAYPFGFDGTNRTLQWHEALEQIIEDRRQNIPVEDIAGAFHNGLAAGITQVALELRERHETNIVALSGGVLQNMLLVGLLKDRLEAAKLQVLFNQKVPANDGGISLGQAALACFAP